MLIGLTGMYCAGKNHAAGILEKRGLAVVDVDKLGHIAIENKKEAIISRFGKDIQTAEGTVNRRLLGAKVFGREDEMAALQDIVHPEANRLTLEWIAAQNGKPCVINAAVLHKSVVFEQLECIILVQAPYLVRLLRAKRRDKLSLADIVKRFSTQRKFFAQYFAGNADIYKVKNSRFSRRKLECQIDEILSRLGL
jgi:dephospho-CoA kinase